MPFLFGAGRRRRLLQKERRGIDMKKFLAARSAYRAAQLPLTSPAGRECAKLREYAELVQSVIDDFQKA